MSRFYIRTRQAPKRERPPLRRPSEQTELAVSYVVSRDAPSIACPENTSKGAAHRPAESRCPRRPATLKSPRVESKERLERQASKGHQRFREVQAIYHADFHIAFEAVFCSELTAIRMDWLRSFDCKCEFELSTVGLSVAAPQTKEAASNYKSIVTNRTDTECQCGDPGAAGTLPTDSGTPSMGVKLMGCKSPVRNWES